MTISERDDLIVNYMPLANKLAWIQKRKVPSSISFDELQSAAYLGLVSAARRFDPQKNIPFMNFASFRIFGEIKDYLRNLKDQINASNLEEDMAGSKKSDNFFDDLILCLNPLGKRIITLYYKDGLSMKDIGIQMGITEGRVSQLIKSYHIQIKCSEKSFA